MRIEIDGPHVELTGEVFSLLADATRVRLILALGDGELPVNALAEQVGKPGCRRIAASGQDAARRHGRQMAGRHPREHDHGHNRGHTHPREHDHPYPHAKGPKGWLQSVFVPHSHDAADSIDEALEASTQGIRAVKLSLLGPGATARFQLAIVLISGSVALHADTEHNFSDALTAVPLWIAFLLGRRRATRTYTYGYGRAEDLAGLFIVAMVTLEAGGTARLRWSGHRLHVEITVPIPTGAHLVELASVSSNLESGLRRALPHVGAVTIVPAFATAEAPRPA